MSLQILNLRELFKLDQIRRMKEILKSRQSIFFLVCNFFKERVYTNREDDIGFCSIYISFT